MLVLNYDQSSRVFPDLYESGRRLAIDGNTLCWLEPVTLVKGKTKETEQSERSYQILLKQIAELEVKLEQEAMKDTQNREIQRIHGEAEIAGITGKLKILWQYLRHSGTWKDAKTTVYNNGKDKWKFQTHYDQYYSQLHQLYRNRDSFQHHYIITGERKGYIVTKSRNIKTSELNKLSSRQVESVEDMTEQQCQRLNTFLTEDPSTEITEKFAQHQLQSKGSKKIIITPQGRHLADGTTVEDYLRTPW